MEEDFLVLVCLESLKGRCFEARMERTLGVAKSGADLRWE